MCLFELFGEVFAWVVLRYPPDVRLAWIFSNIPESESADIDSAMILCTLSLLRLGCLRKTVGFVAGKSAKTDRKSIYIAD